MCCIRSSKEAQAKDEQEKGLVNHHGYGILSVKKLNNPDVVLVQLRNPWGNFEWKGAWSDDDSTRWTE